MPPIIQTVVAARRRWQLPDASPFCMELNSRQHTLHAAVRRAQGSRAADQACACTAPGSLRLSKRSKHNRLIETTKEKEEEVQRGRKWKWKSQD